MILIDAKDTLYDFPGEFQRVMDSFHSRHGKAYLFSKVVNVTEGEKEDRLMMTGLHTVADIFCVGCGSIVGWKYEVALKVYFGEVGGSQVTGPDGNGYWMNHEAQVTGSDADDA
ncbi:yippee-like [Thalictrum thalictroides]|uniref:Yippee-like n=1 Tax=Thalictrum thalictroides TaxID=46969 RepID=A0A7J6V8N5_THATH|nr:yippee-like [Thalictrum thalictroides]